MDDYVQTKGYYNATYKEVARHYCDVVRDHCQQVTKQNKTHYMGHIKIKLSDILQRSMVKKEKKSLVHIKVQGSSKRLY